MHIVPNLCSLYYTGQSITVHIDSNVYNLVLQLVFRVGVTVDIFWLSFGIFLQNASIADKKSHK